MRMAEREPLKEVSADPWRDLDYLKGGERTLWEKPMEIIYFAPAKPAAKLQASHVRCKVGMQRAASDLAALGDEYSVFLAGILNGVLERDPAPFGSDDCE